MKIDDDILKEMQKPIDFHIEETDIDGILQDINETATTDLDDIIQEQQQREDETYRFMTEPEKIDRSVFFDKKFSSWVLNKNGMAIVRNLSKIGMTENDIIKYVLCCSKQTIYNERNRERFLSAYEKGHIVQKYTYPYLLMKKAQRGSDRALIFGCKAICGLSDTRIPNTSDTSILSDFVEAINRLKFEHEREEGTEKQGNPTE